MDGFSQYIKTLTDVLIKMQQQANWEINKQQITAFNFKWLRETLSCSAKKTYERKNKMWIKGEKNQEGYYQKME